ncbi:hypothetical protein [Parasitella parasitica]|uniref:Reverse transcriptase zinc-binding domain-containing protein n=1 Tax=Parasitella parasitica TaxID=35722 RepID=A0A0B7MU62_9FUNG|nr:hypothetical protein [Parasitella parasitica]
MLYSQRKSKIDNPLFRVLTARHEHLVSSITDARSPSPILYLGFPLHTSLAQQDSCLAQPLEKVQQGCLIHQQRGLSARGMATVLNSLILSKLWHVLRVHSVPVSFLRSIQSVISEFIDFRIFPRISFDTACSPRRHGGLGLINPDLQQCTLQLRWLEPLLCQPTEQLSYHPSIVLPRLIGFLVSHLPTRPAPQPPSPPLNHRFSLDRLPSDLSSIIISAATCLEIPLASLVLPTSSTMELPSSFRSLPASVAYTLDKTQDYCMRPKYTLELGSHPNLGKKFLRLVSSNQIKLVPFFVRTFIHSRFSSFGRFPFAQVETQRVVNVSPFVDSLFPSPSTVSRFHIHRFSPKTFRQRCSTPPPRHLLLPPPLNSNLRPSWSAFWSLPISLSCPNVWYRYLHRKIPHNSLLNRFLPEVFPSSSCAICQHPLDSLDHFLFSCPSKLVVWHHIQRVYLGDLGSLHFFRPPPDPHHLMLAQSSRPLSSPCNRCIFRIYLEFSLGFCLQQYFFHSRHCFLSY